MFSEQLKNDIDDYVAASRRESRLLREARNGKLPSSAIGRYFASIHYLLKQTPVHLEFARERALAVGEIELARYFEHKFAEEQGHAAWAEADIAKLAEVFGVAAIQEPVPGIVKITKNTRAAIERDPFLYLPYILFAEYFTVKFGPDLIGAFARYCGVPTDAMTAVGNHVELDRDHVTEGCKEIDALVSDEGRHEALRDMLRDTMQRVTAFYDELCEAA